MNRIFITGCQKSGTTLLARMFSAFSGVYVCNEEVKLDSFVTAYPHNEKFHTLVGKRTVGHIFSDVIGEDKKQSQLALIKKHDIKIVNMVRDGREVVESMYQEWGVYNPFVWMDCIMQDKELGMGAEWFKQIRYEDLVENPMEYQGQIERHWGLNAEQAWTAYPAFVSKEIFPSNKPNYKLRKLELKKYNTDRWRAMPNNDWYFDKLNKELGYE